MNIDQTMLQKVNEYFHDNESTKQYLQIISTALERQKDFQPTINKYAWGTVGVKKKIYFDFYNEMHHIIPKSIDKELEKYKPNWVVLTSQEHFTVHKLLVDMCINKDHYYSMSKAYSRMCNINRGWEITAEEYALARELHSISQSAKMKGSKRSKESIIKGIESRKWYKPTEETIRKSAEARSESVECYIIVGGKEVIIDKFTSSSEANNKTGCSDGNISSVCYGIRESTGTYNLDTKQYNEIDSSGIKHLPNKKNPTTYKLHWRKENSESTIVITPRELYECYIILDDKEILLDRFDSSREAQVITNGNQAAICSAANCKINSSGTYNLSTKQYNEIKFGARVTLPNNKYPTTYKCMWRKIKE